MVWPMARTITGRAPRVQLTGGGGWREGGDNYSLNEVPLKFAGRANCAENRRSISRRGREDDKPRSKYFSAGVGEMTFYDL